jgi:gas vesicle protein
MNNFRFGAAALGLTFAALTAASASAAIGSKADCEYEGGQVFNVKGATVCVVAVRPSEYMDEIYDGQQLGVKECEGEEISEGAFCRITLSSAPVTTASDPATTGEMMEKTGDAMEEAADNTGDAMETMADNAGDAMKESAENKSDAERALVKGQSDAMEEAAEDKAKILEDKADAYEDKADEYKDAVDK